MATVDPYEQVVNGAEAKLPTLTETRMLVQAGTKIHVTQSLLRAMVSAVKSGRDYVVVDELAVIDGEAVIQVSA